MPQCIRLIGGPCHPFKGLKKTTHSMAKTAEEIAKKWGFDSDSDAIEAMLEFSAQEVEAYKRRLKDAFFKRISETRGMEHFSKSDIHELIERSISRRKICGICSSLYTQ